MEGLDGSGDSHVRKHHDTRVYFDESSHVLAKRMRCEPPRQYANVKRKDEIDFYVPHKTLLREREEKAEIDEPITGFLDKQEEIRKKVFKPYYPVPEVRDPPYETPVKSWFIRQRPIKIVVQPKGKVIDMDPSTSYVSRRIPPVFVDQLELMKNLRNNPGIGFYYMVYAVDRSSEFFNPYALKVVPYKEIDKVYMTIGANGVTQYTPNEMTFTPIELWEREYRSYVMLIKIRSFAIFRKWKAFNVWRKTIKYNKIMQARNYLEKNLFLCDNILRKAILEIKGMCSIFLYSSLVDTTVIQQLLPFYFVEMQFAKLEKIRDKLNEFRRLTVNILNNACLGSLLEAGFTPDDSNITVEQTALGKAGIKFRIPKDGVLKMSYIEQARKREKCARLACFIHVVDYYQLSMMQNFLRNTYMELLQALEIHTNLLPPVEEFENLAVDYLLKSRRVSKCEVQSPYFVVDLLVNPELGIVLDPLESIFWHVLTTLQSMWEETMKKIDPLLSDELFHPFTRPLINGRIEKPTCGDPPDIITVVNEDPTLINFKAKFKETWEKNFDAVKNYSRRFANIWNFYQEDMEFDENQLIENEKCDVFRKWCERYRCEEEEINSSVEVQPLGIFQIQQERFKASALPAPNQKQKVLSEVMPRLGKLRVDELLEEATEAIDFLNSDPVSTEDYAEYIKFVDQALKKVDKMEAKLDYVKELYDIMEEYQFPAPPEDMANYLGISVYFTTMRLAVEKQRENRTKLITKFNKQIHKDINLLIDRIQAITDEVTQPWLLDAESNAYVCLETLNELNDRLNECANLANDYRSHQKAFKIEMTRFEILEQVQNDVKLRILLWQSLATWDETVASWYEVDFETLNM